MWTVVAQGSTVKAHLLLPLLCSYEKRSVTSRERVGQAVQGVGQGKP